MKYLALLHGREDASTDPSSPEFADEIARYARFDELAGDAVLGGEALHPSSEAVTVRHRDGQTVVTDGPWIESTEVCGGFYVLEADDLDGAVALAREIPAAEQGCIEVRPLVEWSQADRPVAAGARRWLALLVGEENEASVPDTASWEEATAAHARFGELAGEAVVGGGALQPAESATTLRVRDGALQLTDGPFPEVAEVVGGLYLLEAATRDEVVELGRRMPMTDGAVELRPIVAWA